MNQATDSGDVTATLEPSQTGLSCSGRLTAICRERLIRAEAARYSFIL
jgi:hypothetical protein